MHEKANVRRNNIILTIPTPDMNDEKMQISRSVICLLSWCSHSYHTSLDQLVTGQKVWGGGSGLEQLEMWQIKNT